MLNENDVVDHVAAYLEKNGYKIIQKLKVTEKGIDIIANHPQKGDCYVEAKGGTPTNEYAKNYGKEFNKTQVIDHVGSVIFQTLKIRQEHKDSVVYIAIPNTDDHKKNINSVKECLAQLRINILLVNDDGKIEEI